jgi:hypothetical protein
VAAILTADSDAQANLINAQSAAEEHGVVVRSSHAEPNARVSKLHLRLTGPTSTVECSGTLVHGTSPRLVQLNGIDIESRLEGDFVVVANLDAPGVVGSIGTHLGAHGINIARLSLGREGPNALAIVELDGVVSSDVLAGLRAAPSVRQVTSVRV